MAIIIHFPLSKDSSINKAYTWIFTSCLWQKDPANHYDTLRGVFRYQEDELAQGTHINSGLT